MLKKINVPYMQMLYNNWHTDGRHFLLYEEYKERLEEFERQKKEFYRKDFRLPDVPTMIDYSLDYRFELERLKELGYRGYCFDWDYREHNARLEETDNGGYRLHIYRK